MQDEPRNSSLLDAGGQGGVDDVERDREIVGDEIGRERVVGVDAADARRPRGTSHRACAAPARLRSAPGGSGRRSRGRRVRISQPSDASRRTIAEPAMPLWPATADALAVQIEQKLRTSSDAHSRRPRPGCWSFMSARSASTISRTSSSNADLVLPAELRVRLGRIAEQELDLGRAEIARIDLDQHAAGAGLDALLVDALAVPFDPLADVGESPLDELAHRMASRRSRARSRRASAAAGSATCPRHSRAHGPSRAWRRDCRDRACPAARARSRRRRG